MLVGALLARRNVKLGRGDRRGAFRAAPRSSCCSCARGCSATTTSARRHRSQPLLRAIGSALFNAGVSG
jgi:hypothetical protein